MEAQETKISQQAKDYAMTLNGIIRQSTAAIDYQKGFDDATRWIPVTEAMPPHGERVLVMAENRWTNIGRWLNIAGEEENRKPDFRWIVGNTNRNWNVTHWRKI